MKIPMKQYRLPVENLCYKIYYYFGVYAFK